VGLDRHSAPERVVKIFAGGSRMRRLLYIVFSVTALAATLAPALLRRARASPRLYGRPDRPIVCRGYECASAAGGDAPFTYGI